MHRVGRAIVLATTFCMVASIVLGSAAEARTPVYCDPITNLCTVVVKDPGHGGGQRSGRGDDRGGATTSGDSRPSKADLCYSTLADPQPPASDPIWSGHPSGSGRVYMRVCPMTKSGPISVMVWVANGARPPTVTPAQLAREALASLRLPAPTFQRSPDAGNSDQGVPYTWVNLWTWYWTSPASWQVLSRRVAVGPVWAQVTATPTELVFDPGDGAAAVSCPGPGRPWRTSDGNGQPSGGGCGYIYRGVSVNGPLTATVSIRWTVTWTGSQGTGGTLPVMATEAASTFAVQQIQAVTR
jgi:hypothetical protein